MSSPARLSTSSSVLVRRHLRGPAWLVAVAQVTQEEGGGGSRPRRGREPWLVPGGQLGQGTPARPGRAGRPAAARAGREATATTTSPLAVSSRSRCSAWSAAARLRGDGGQVVDSPDRGIGVAERGQVAELGLGLAEASPGRPGSARSAATPGRPTRCGGPARQLAAWSAPPRSPWARRSSASRNMPCGGGARVVQVAHGLRRPTAGRGRPPCQCRPGRWRRGS